MLILSGDHIYKMNYGRMLKQHQDSGADVTLATIQIDPDECFASAWWMSTTTARHRFRGEAEVDASCDRR